MTVSARSLQRHVHATDDNHRVTSLELFFDLVFVYGLTQVTALMAAGDPTWHKSLEGLLVMALLWFAWSSYAWLGNQAKADEGVLRLALVVAMVCVFLAALAIPNAFQEAEGGIDAALLLVFSIIALRFVHLTVYLIAAGDDRGLRHQLLVTAIPIAGWAVLLAVGAGVGGDKRLAVWALALAVDYVGIFVSARAGGWRLNAAAHFAERHGLIVIIAIGESIVSIGVGAAAFPLTGAVLAAVLFGLAISVTLWWSYFDFAAPVAEKVLTKARGENRARLARDSYTYLHFPMVVGIIYAALGMKKVVNYVADTTHHELGDPLATVPLVSLYGGVVLYLLAHICFRLRNIHSLNKQRLGVAVLLVVLLPVVAHVPALAAFAVLTALMVALICYEVTKFGAAREAMRHAGHG
jgi:low temperature requirement protein LtrA